MFEIRHGVSVRCLVAAQRASRRRAAPGGGLAGSCPCACRPAIAKLRSTLNVSCQPHARYADSVLQSPDIEPSRAARRTRAPGDNGTALAAPAPRPR
ncbi:hypothetical protein CA830_16650 [Burkholderia multivorans]|nr:hypothetical protein CA831_18150 [Burkholderia multivorans]OXH89945.1 hypothetical protein CA830_16650 [Burkholderia multivorans]